MAHASLGQGHSEGLEVTGRPVRRAGSHEERGLPGNSACLEMQFLPAYGEQTEDADVSKL